MYGRKRKMKVSSNDIRTVLAKTNPFVLRMDDGRLCYYEYLDTCYHIVMVKLFNDYRAGFVDVPLFMLTHQLVSEKTAARICPEKQYAFIEWWNLESYEVQFKLKYIFKLLLKVGEFQFDEECFNRALTDLKQEIAKRDLKLNKNNLNKLSTIYG